MYENTAGRKHWSGKFVLYVDILENVNLKGQVEIQMVHSEIILNRAETIPNVKETDRYFDRVTSI